MYPIEKQNNNIEDFLRESIPIISKESERVWYKVNDVTVLEQKCYNQLISTYNKLGEDIKNPQAVIWRIVKRVSADYIKRSKKEDVLSLESLAGLDNEDSEGTGFQPRDILANVESEVLAKEKIALLAKGDLKNEIILNAWKDGCTSATKIASLLADKLGGDIETNRVDVYRLRKKCKLTLAS